MTDLEIETGFLHLRSCFCPLQLRWTITFCNTCVRDGRYDYGVADMMVARVTLARVSHVMKAFPRTHSLTHSLGQHDLYPHFTHRCGKRHDVADFAPPAIMESHVLLPAQVTAPAQRASLIGIVFAAQLGQYDGVLHGGCVVCQQGKAIGVGQWAGEVGDDE